MPADRRGQGRPPFFFLRSAEQFANSTLRVGLDGLGEGNTQLAHTPVHINWRNRREMLAAHGAVRRLLTGEGEIGNTGNSRYICELGDISGLASMPR